MSIQKDRITAMLNLTAEIVRSNPKLGLYNVTAAVQELATLAKTLHNRYEAACNYEQSDAADRRTDKLEGKVAKIALDLGIQIECQRDPRGWPLIIKSGPYESRLG